MQQITLEDYFGRTSKIEEPSDQVVANATALLGKVNDLFNDLVEIYGMHQFAKPEVRSGWRPSAYNAQVVGAAPNSKHITGNAVDIADNEGELDEFLYAKTHLLVKHGLYMEHPAATKSWCHLQDIPPRSGNRVFYP